MFLSGSTGRVYQLQVRTSCRMRYLHYSTLENTRSFLKRIAKRIKKKISLIPPPVTAAEIRPSRNLAEKLTKNEIPNSGLNVFLSGSTGRVYQLQVRSSCRMRYLHYSTLENTRSFIKRIAKRIKKNISLIPPPVTTAEIRPSRNLAEKN